MGLGVQQDGAGNSMTRAVLWDNAVVAKILSELQGSEPSLDDQPLKSGVVRFTLGGVTRQFEFREDADGIKFFAKYAKATGHSIEQIEVAKTATLENLSIGWLMGPGLIRQPVS